MSREGIALVLSAPSGAGKSTLIAKLREEFPGLRYSVSCTTRTPRTGEREGVDYCFLSPQEFLKQRDLGHFAEWAEVHGNFYGTPLAPIKKMLAAGEDVLLDLDVQGAAQLKLSLAEASFIFILPPSLDELERRLRLRGLDDEESISLRLENARAELGQAGWYETLIVNDDLDRAYHCLRCAYLAETMRASRNGGLIAALLEGRSIKNG